MLLFKNHRNVLKNTLFNVSKVVLAKADRLEFHFCIVDFLQSCRLLKLIRTPKREQVTKH